jgi:hypothetical protein
MRSSSGATCCGATPARFRLASVCMSSAAPLQEHGAHRARTAAGAYPVFARARRPRSNELGTYATARPQCAEVGGGCAASCAADSHASIVQLKGGSQVSFTQNIYAGVHARAAGAARGGGAR